MRLRPRRLRVHAREGMSSQRKGHNVRFALVAGTALAILLTVACGLLCISTEHSRLWWLAYVMALCLATTLLAHHRMDEHRFFIAYATLVLLETSIWFWSVEHMVMSAGDWILAGAFLFLAVLSLLLHRRGRQPG